MGIFVICVIVLVMIRQHCVAVLRSTQQTGIFFILFFASQDIAEDLDYAECIYFTIDLCQKDDNPLNSVKM